jgi:hypothetical protein
MISSLRGAFQHLVLPSKLTIEEESRMQCTWLTYEEEGPLLLIIIKGEEHRGVQGTM